MSLIIFDMNFHLTQPYQYGHLKMWFAENKSKLPKTLDTDIAVFLDVHQAIETNIARIERQFEMFGQVTEISKASKRLLVTIYDTMKNNRA